MEVQNLLSSFLLVIGHIKLGLVLFSLLLLERNEEMRRKTTRKKGIRINIRSYSVIKFSDDFMADKENYISNIQKERERKRVCGTYQLTAAVVAFQFRYVF